LILSICYIEVELTTIRLENPSSEFHISAKYVNSSAVATEIYHVVNRQRVTDVMLTARLNNSHLLHSRVHWRPELIDDLKVRIFQCCVLC